MLYIPQRHYICTDRCLRANLRRRGGLPPAEPQVRQKNDSGTPPLILTFLPFLLFVNFLIAFFSSHFFGLWSCFVFSQSLSADFCGCAHLKHKLQLLKMFPIKGSTDLFSLKHSLAYYSSTQKYIKYLSVKFKIL